MEVVSEGFDVATFLLKLWKSMVFLLKKYIRVNGKLLQYSSIRRWSHVFSLVLGLL